MQQAEWIRLSGKVAALTFGLVVAGCGGGEVASVGNDIAKTVISGNASGKSVVDDVDPSIFVKDIPCPPLEVEAGRYFVTHHQRGKDDDPRALIYQASLEKWARSCRREGGEVKMTLGVSGRVTPGPAFQGGEIFLPIRVTYQSLDDGNSKAKPETRVLTVPVTLGAGAPAEQWALVEENFVVPQGPSIKVQIALDENAKRRQ